MIRPMLNSVINFTIQIKDLIKVKFFFTYYGLEQNKLRSWKNFTSLPKENQKIFVARLDGTCFNVVRYHESKLESGLFENRYEMWHEVPSKKQLVEQKNFLMAKEEISDDSQSD